MRLLKLRYVICDIEGEESLRTCVGPIYTSRSAGCERL